MTDGPPGESLPIRLGQETAEFIETHREEPFFAFLSFYSVHAPLQTTKRLWAKYREKAAQQPTPDHRFIVDRTSPVRQVQDHPVYGGMVEAMDDAVGIVLATFDRLNLSDQTVIVFTSDNGGVSAGDGKATSNLPLRGGKGRQWEGGIREPYYIRWPGVTKPGSTSSALVTGTDFYPTLCEIAGLPLRPEQHVDGVSLVPLLKGQTLPSRPLFWHYPHYGNQGGEPSSIIRSGDWKLIRYYEDHRDELYNLVEDPVEQNDVASAQPEVVKELFEQLEAWLKETNARFPNPNPGFDEREFAERRVQIRTKQLPALEKQHAAVLESNWNPRGGWWEDKGS